MTKPILRIDDLRATLVTRDRTLPLLNGISLELQPGEALGLVGESGSGKSLTTRAIMRMLETNFRVSGDVQFAGESVYKMSRSRLREYRSADVGMIFQDPRAHVNPVHTVGDFLTEALVRNRGLPRDEVEKRAVALLDEVGVRHPERRLTQYPHELSGGLLQRVLIASVLLAEPRLILADEPTTALDVTAQSDVMAILEEQRQARGLSLLFITHNLELAQACCDRLAVMYAGEIVEQGAHVYAAPTHPYTKELMGARPSIDIRADRLPELNYSIEMHQALKAEAAL
ncbi:ABC transporter ATP-binding protein [Glaciibacter psychrotolerans]|uniref:ABC-type dipeptide/oligopeptide/nickel transport system ATPase component n=1 Tax=Glaciibacter psychrotolerans TaxID=670054 RepID=A0A7Z0J4Q4_9MICO|nr:ABC transporter ATP-binding protein [Leifsonia psychrotolerans]NYJ18637.1 ABC-type dipeptide/oligopeptide/nickel transport system ATPase component [Leifsonia psychrotolerans]